MENGYANPCNDVEDMNFTQDGVVDAVTEFLNNLGCDQLTNDDTPMPSPMNHFDLLFQDDTNEFVGNWNNLVELYNAPDTSRIVVDEISKYCMFLNERPFNVQFRGQFCNAIEKTSWNLILDDDNEMATGAVQLVLSKVQEREQELNTQQEYRDLTEASSLNRWKQELKAVSQRNPMDFVGLMKQILDREKYIIQHAHNSNLKEEMMKTEPLSPSSTPHPHQEPDHTSLSAYRGIPECERNSDNIANEFNTLGSKYRDLMVKTGENIFILDQLNMESTNFVNQHQRNNVIEVQRLRESAIVCKQQLCQNLSNAADSDLALLVVILKQIESWQRIRAWELNGKALPMDACTLETIAQWCNRLVKVLYSNYNKAQNLLSMEAIDMPVTREQNRLTISQIVKTYEDMIKKLIERALVIEKHPPQVLMKDKKFQCQLRHLIGDGLDIHRASFNCEVAMVYGNEYGRLKKEGSYVQLEQCGKIMNAKTKSDYQEQTGQLQVCMRNMCLQLKQRGGDRGKAEIVAEEKFVMVFRAHIFTRFTSGGNNLVEIRAQALSLPIVVISHGKQEPDAQATIFWDNAFSDPNRDRFIDVPRSVMWPAMLREIDYRWQKDCGLGLSNEAKEFLTLKLFKHRNIEAKEIMTWQRFNRDPVLNGMSDKSSFTFWTWFFRLMELVKNKMVNKYWNEGLILGFITKESTHDKLLAENIKLGTFLFRFSESLLGAVSIACKEKLENGHIHIRHYQPDNVNDFKVLSIAKMVDDLQNLVYLYPDKPKTAVFEKYLVKSRPPPPPVSSDHHRYEYVGKGFKAVVDS